MLTPERLLRFMIEFVFVLLGVLLVWLGVRGPIHGRTVDRHSTAWLILSVAIILWGLRALPRKNQWWARWQNWTRSLSLVLLGSLMLAIKWVPFAWVGPMLAAGGMILAIRGVVSSALIFRPR
jgi:hypothetical protein